MKIGFESEIIAKPTRVTRDRYLYVIRNSRLVREWAEVKRQTFGIAEPISALINSHGLGDLNRTFMTARRDQLDFNLVCISEHFNEVAKVPFDREYKQKLFNVAIGPWVANNMRYAF